METNDNKNVEYTAIKNYKTSEPWPKDDIWHSYTYNILHMHVQCYLNELRLNDTQIILNAGCGKTSYDANASIIYMDIIKEYIDSFDNYLVGSIEKIPLPDGAVDCIICVGSVINYADIQKALFEFSRVLKPNGTLILEFERSNSAEFLLTPNYSKTVFMQKYHYNNQTHYLWMYNEKFVFQLAEYYKLVCIKKYRYHILSSLFFRMRVSEIKAAKYSKLDNLLQPFSRFFAHNEIAIFKKLDL